MLSVVDGTENRVKCAQCSKFIYKSKPRYLCLDCKEFYICVECKPTVNHKHELLYEKSHSEKIRREVRYGDSVCAVLCNAFKLWAKRPCLGYRELDSTGQFKKEFKWLSYQEVFERMKNFGFGLRQLVDLKDFIGIFGRNSIDWYIATFSCYVNSIIGPVIPYNLGADGVTHIVNHTKMKGLVCDDTTIENALIVSKNTPSISFLIFIPNQVLTKTIVQEKYGHLIREGLKVYSFSEIERMGKKNNSFMLVGNTNPDDVATLIYTSGSTGVPKGVVVTEKYARKWLETDITYGSYSIALRWSNSERETDLRAVVCGLRTGIYSRNVDLLFEDIQILQPSSVAATPVFWNKIYAEFKANVNELMQQGHSYEQADVIALAKFSTILGGRVEKIMTGGAPISPDVFALMKRLFSNNKVYESYGASEVGTIATNGYLSSKLTYKLEDWEGYSSKDLPYPRGELCVKKEYRSNGYYSDASRTDEVFIDGWYHTGDIIELLPNDEIRIIDRKKSIFKLAQGEFVAPSRLEGFYAQSPFIEDIYVHGNPFKSYLLCVIHPKREVVDMWAQKHFTEKKSFEEVLKTPDATILITNELQRIAQKEHLRPHEIPLGVILVPEPLIKSDDRKIMRHLLEKQFQKEISEAYERLGDEPQRIIKASNDNGNEEITQKIKKMLEELGISVPAADASTKLNFAGVDSLSAVKLRNMIKSDYKIDLPMNALFSENATVESLSKLVTTSKVDPATQFDIRKELEILDEIIPKIDITSNSKQNSNGVKSVLLTGVTGFLGTQLLYELLTTRPEISTIYCLIRPAKDRNNIIPIDIVKARFAYAKTEWLGRYDQIVKPVVGDVSQERFGLVDEIYKELSANVDQIYHSAAQVNAVLPYSVLKSANVIGTKNVIDFSWTGKLKSLIHVSTTSACWTDNYLKEIELNYENFAEEFNKRANIFGGYNTSKFVAEKLVYKANKLGLNTIILRPGMISSSSLSGYCNEDDFDNLLLRGIIMSQKAPFFTEARLEMTPVDFTAKVIVAAGSQIQRLNGKIFNIYSPYRVRFDELVTTIEEVTEFSFEKYPFHEWKQTVLPNLPPDNPIQQLIEAYFAKREVFPQRDLNFETFNTDQLIAENQWQFPKVDGQVIEKHVKFLLKRGIDVVEYFARVMLVITGSRKEGVIKIADFVIGHNTWYQTYTITPVNTRAVRKRMPCCLTWLTGNSDLNAYQVFWPIALQRNMEVEFLLQISFIADYIGVTLKFQPMRQKIGKADYRKVIHDVYEKYNYPEVLQHMVHGLMARAVAEVYKLDELRYTREQWVGYMKNGTRRKNVRDGSENDLDRMYERHNKTAKLILKVRVERYG